MSVKKERDSLFDTEEEEEADRIFMIEVAASIMKEKKMDKLNKELTDKIAAWKSDDRFAEYMDELYNYTLKEKVEFLLKGEATFDSAVEGWRWSGKFKFRCK